MIEILSKLSPVIATFILGIFLRRITILKREDADLFLRVVFYISAPALVLSSISKVHISPVFALLPLCSAGIILITLLISSRLLPLFQTNRQSLGSMVLSTIIINGGFILPFAITMFGEEGVARASMFDFGNALLTFTLAYFVACSYSKSIDSHKAIAYKLLKSPPLWALLSALVLNIAGITLPIVIDGFLRPLGGLTAPLIMLSLGIYFNIKEIKLSKVIPSLLLRMGLGLFLGFITTRLFQFDHLTTMIIIISAAAPAGYNTITFASMENLDKELAANIVSLSVLVGLILVPALLFILK